MNVYLFNEKKELIERTLHSVDYIDPMTPFVPENAVIADAELPQLAANQAHKVSGSRNADGHYTVSNNVFVVDDYREVDTFNTSTGELEKVTEIGELPDYLTTLPPPSKYHTWLNDKWSLTEDAEERQLKDSREARLSELNVLAEATVEALAHTSRTPEFERATWELQRMEAEAWHADNTTPTPNLDRIAASRGVDADVLRAKAYEKAMQYQMLTTTIAGQRQKFEDLIDAAETLDALTALKFEFGVS